MQTTRQAILIILKEQGQATVDQLSAQLELTPVTIRHHLDILRSEGLVDTPKVKRRSTPGRPQHVYTLTEQANEYFPKNYATFADFTLTEVREQVGAEQMDSIVRGVAHRMASDAPPALPGDPLGKRLDQVVEFLNAKGYIARWEHGEQGYLLHTVNCPYHGLTEQHNTPCVMDMALISELLGRTPQRVSWIRGGDPACTYIVHNSESPAQAT